MIIKHTEDRYLPKISENISFSSRNWRHLWDSIIGLVPWIYWRGFQVKLYIQTSETERLCKLNTSTVLSSGSSILLRHKLKMGFSLINFPFCWSSKKMKIMGDHLGSIPKLVCQASPFTCVHIYTDRQFSPHPLHQKLISILSTATHSSSLHTGSFHHCSLNQISHCCTEGNSEPCIHAAASVPCVFSENSSELLLTGAEASASTHHPALLKQEVLWQAPKGRGITASKHSFTWCWAASLGAGAQAVELPRLHPTTEPLPHSPMSRGGRKGIASGHPPLVCFIA